MSEDVIEILDTKTGIVYACTSHKNIDTAVPMLFNNGQPLHYNKEEVDKVKDMILAIGESRYQDICSSNYSTCDFSNIGVVRYFASIEWSVQDVYNRVCSNSKISDAEETTK